MPINQIVCGHAAEVMANWPSNSIDAIITSPPYYNLVKYEGGLPWNSYAEFLDDMMGVWAESARVLVPNGRLAFEDWRERSIGTDTARKSPGGAG